MKFVAWVYNPEVFEKSCKNEIVVQDSLNSDIPLSVVRRTKNRTFLFSDRCVATDKPDTHEIRNLIREDFPHTNSSKYIYCFPIEGNIRDIELTARVVWTRDKTLNAKYDIMADGVYISDLRLKGENSVQECVNNLFEMHANNNTLNRFNIKIYRNGEQVGYVCIAARRYRAGTMAKCKNIRVKAKKYLCLLFEEVTLV